MASENRSRGKEGSDDRLFSLKAQTQIKEAVKDLCFLLSRGYAEKSAVQLVGNRYRLNVRQQKVLHGMAAGEEQLSRRKRHLITPDEMKGKEVFIDGFNLLIILESALSGAYIFKGVDGAIRDISSVHGSYKRVKQTNNAFKLVADSLIELGVKSVKWYFDSPVSNSGRLKSYLLEFSSKNHLKWEVELDFNPDKKLIESDGVIISSDAWILDECKSWFNMAQYILNYKLDKYELVIP